MTDSTGEAEIERFRSSRLCRALDLVIYAEALALGTESMSDQEYNDVLGIAGEIARAD